MSADQDLIAEAEEFVKYGSDLNPVEADRLIGELCTALSRAAAPEPLHESEWEYRVVTLGGTIWLQTQVLGQALASAEANPGDEVERRRKAGPWEPLPVGGETDGE